MRGSMRQEAVVGGRSRTQEQAGGRSRQEAGAGGSVVGGRSGMQGQ